MARAAVRALRAGRPVIMPTDTVYGLVADASEERSARLLARLKGRPASMPCALMVACVDSLLEALPELDGTAEEASRALLPGPLTLVLPNPAGRFPWLAGARPATIGVRVPELPPVSREILGEVAAARLDERQPPRCSRPTGARGCSPGSARGGRRPRGWWPAAWRAVDRA